MLERSRVVDLFDHRVVKTSLLASVFGTPTTAGSNSSWPTELDYEIVLWSVRFEIRSTAG